MRKSPAIDDSSNAPNGLFITHKGSVVCFKHLPPDVIPALATDPSADHWITPGAIVWTMTDQERSDFADMLRDFDNPLVDPNCPETLCEICIDENRANQGVVSNHSEENLSRSTSHSGSKSQSNERVRT